MKPLCLLSVLTLALSGCTAVLQGFTSWLQSPHIRRSIMARSATALTSRKTNRISSGINRLRLSMITTIGPV